MKKILLFLCLAILITGFASAQVRTGGTLYVAVRNLELKSGTGWFASTRSRLNYGERVTVIQVSGKFVEVRSASNSSQTGWTASSNLSARQVVTGTTSTATAREVALAGKGFNQEVEQSYRTQQRNLNYADVDRVETTTIDQTAFRRFLEEGRLSMGE